MGEAAEKLPEEVGVTLLPPEAVLGLRGQIVELLGKAIAEDAAPIETADDVIEQSLDGRTQIWLAHQGNEVLGVSTTIVVLHPRTKVVRVIYTAGGDLDRWQGALLDAYKAFARSQECSALEWFAGRRGWTKRAKQVGAVPIGTLYRMGLEDGDGRQ